MNDSLVKQDHKLNHNVHVVTSFLYIQLKSYIHTHTKVINEESITEKYSVSTNWTIAKLINRKQRVQGTHLNLLARNLSGINKEVVVLGVNGFRG